MQEDRQAIQTKHAKAWQKHRQQDQRIVYRRYFTESCKTITGMCHIHRRHYRQHMSCRYSTESCKKITAPAIITDGFSDAITDGGCIFQGVRLSDCLVGRHSCRRNHRRTRQIQCARDLTHNYRWICRQTLKNLEGFSKFWWENQLNINRHYRLEFNATAQKNIILFSVGISVEKIVV